MGYYKAVLNISISNGTDDDSMQKIVKFRDQNQFAEFESDGFDELKEQLESLTPQDYFVTDIIEYDRDAEDYEDVDIDVTEW